MNLDTQVSRADLLAAGRNVITIRLDYPKIPTDLFTVGDVDHQTLQL